MDDVQIDNGDALKNDKLEPNPWYSHRGIVIYECFEGYTLHGPQITVCLHGEWSRKPLCIKSGEVPDEGLLPEVPGEEIPYIGPILPSRYEYVYDNDKQTLLIKNRSAKKFSRIFPDVAVCPLQPVHENLFVSLVGEEQGWYLFGDEPTTHLNHGEEIESICVGYGTLIGPERSTCVDGHVMLPVCYDICVSPYMLDFVGRKLNPKKHWSPLKGDNYFEHGAQVEIACSNILHNYVDGDRVFICDNGRWQGKLGKCIPKSVEKQRAIIEFIYKHTRSQ